LFCSSLSERLCFRFGKDLDNEFTNADMFNNPRGPVELTTRHRVLVSRASGGKKKYHTLSATYSRSIPNKKAIKTQSVATKAGDEMDIVGIVILQHVVKRCSGHGEQQENRSRRVQRLIKAIKAVFPEWQVKG
jgi:hypothetical protein